MTSWCTPEQLAAIQHLRDEMRAALRERYGKENLMPDKPVYGKQPDLQAALDVAVKAAKLTGQAVEINLKNYTGTGVIRPPEVKSEAAPVKRIGDATRDIYISHLQEMFTQGYLSQEEFSSRSNAAIAALTERDLTKLISDLPGLPAPAPAVVEEKEEHRYSASQAYLVSAIAMLILVIIGGAHRDLPVFTLSWVWMSAFAILSRVTKKREIKKEGDMRHENCGGGCTGN
jgi:DUF1707 SHOCT-like domain